jgi:hypothetical protein
VERLSPWGEIDTVSEMGAAIVAVNATVAVPGKDALNSTVALGVLVGGGGGQRSAARRACCARGHAVGRGRDRCGWRPRGDNRLRRMCWRRG